MVGRSQVGAVNENGGGLTAAGPTISELDEDNRLLKEKLRTETSEKLKSQKDCAFYKEWASRLKEENDGLLKRVKESAGVKKEILELKKKNCELQCAILTAKTDVEYGNTRYNALLERVAALEKDKEVMDKLEKMREAVDKGIERDALVNLPLDTNAGKVIVSQEVKSGVETEKLDCDDKVLSGTNQNGKCPGNSNCVEIDKDAVGVAVLALDTNAGKRKVSKEADSRLENGMRGSDEKLLSETNRNPSDRSSHRKLLDNIRPLSKDIVEIQMEIDQDAVTELALDPNAGKEKVSEEVESRLEYGNLGSDEKLSETNPNRSDSSSHRKIPDNNRPSSKEIIEIIDSDDEAGSRGGTKSTCTVMKGHMDKEHSQKNIVEKDPTMPKRALASSVDVGDRCPRIESSKRLKIRQNVPFTCHMESYLETRSSGKVDTSKMLSELGDDSSSSSGSDDDLDLSYEFPDFNKTETRKSKSPSPSP